MLESALPDPKPSPYFSATALAVEFSQRHTFCGDRFLFQHDEILEKSFAHTPDPVSKVPKSSCFNSAPSICCQVEAETKSCWYVEGEKGGQRQCGVCRETQAGLPARTSCSSAASLPGWARVGSPHLQAARCTQAWPTCSLSWALRVSTD